MDFWDEIKIFILKFDIQSVEDEQMTGKRIKLRCNRPDM